MAEHQLPAYLQARQVQDFTDYASDGIGAALPAHVSIQGNMFTLIDATGSEFEPLREMDCVIVDRSNFACKIYYGGKDWKPNSDEPPVCWSTNGIGPSKDAATPQARTCGECEFNVRGSAVSKISGASIKACRDEYHMAILVPTLPDMMFRYVLTPGSFDNWQAYTAKFKNGNVKISMVVTRMKFEAKVNGVVTFESVSYVDEQTNGLVVKALQEKATDLYCGRMDSPRVAAIAGPQTIRQEIPDRFTDEGRAIPFGQGNPAQAAGPQHGTPTTLPGSPRVAAIAGPAPANQLASAPQPDPQLQQQTSQQVQRQVPFASPAGAQQPSTAQPAATTGPQTTAAPSAAQAPPAEHPAPRKRRRTAAEMAAANGAGPAQASPAPAGVGGSAPRAPFPVAGNPTTVPPTNNFGMAEGQPAAGNPELAGMLDDFFK